MRPYDSLLNRLKQARLKQEPILRSDLQEEEEPQSIDEGYDWQDRLHSSLVPELGELAGYKIGCTTPVMQEYLGIPHPCAGGVFRKTVHRESVEIPFKSLIKPGVECEIAVWLAQDIPMDRDLSSKSLAEYVESCCASIEIVDDRYSDFKSFSTPTLIADDFFNAAVVLGKPFGQWRELDLAQVSGSMKVNGEKVGEGSGALILGHPMEALTWIVEHLKTRNTCLKAGEFVTLGSVVQTVWIAEPNTEVVIEFGGMGTASVRFVQ